ncbi:MAG: MerR family transcriptional regulator [Bacteroidales bacterium]|nr:MerR family transcriptional regulator [Bacteroidales bacterium]
MNNDYNKKYYKISEVAEILNIPASTLRFWENQFTIIKPKRNNHGIRLYAPADIETIKMVYYLVKEKGLKLDAAQEQIKHNRSNVSQRHKAIERLKHIRTELKNMIDALHSLR